MGSQPTALGLVGTGLPTTVWVPSGQSGQNGRPNVDWTVTPHVPGTTRPLVIDGLYDCVDEEPYTWSQDAGSAGRGFCEVIVTPAVPTGSTSGGGSGAGSGSATGRIGQPCGSITSPGYTTPYPATAFTPGTIAPRSRGTVALACGTVTSQAWTGARAPRQLELCVNGSQSDFQIINGRYTIVSSASPRCVAEPVASGAATGHEVTFPTTGLTTGTSWWGYLVTGSGEVGSRTCFTSADIATAMFSRVRRSSPRHPRSRLIRARGPRGIGRDQSSRNLSVTVMPF